MVVVAPVSRARRTKRLSFGPLIRTYTISRPTSRRRGYSGPVRHPVSDGVDYAGNACQAPFLRNALGLVHPQHSDMLHSRPDAKVGDERLSGPCHRGVVETAGAHRWSSQCKTGHLLRSGGDRCSTLVSNGAGTEGDRVAVRERCVRVESERQPLHLAQPIVDFIAMRGMRQQAPSTWNLSPRIHPINRNEQPLSAKPLADVINRLASHDRDLLARSLA